MKLKEFLREYPAYANMLKYLVTKDPVLWAQGRDLKARFQIDIGKWWYFANITGPRNGNGMLETKQVREMSFIRVSPDPSLREILKRVIREAQEYEADT